jgi:hypothetical protein
MDNQHIRGILVHYIVVVVSLVLVKGRCGRSHIQRPKQGCQADCPRTRLDHNFYKIEKDFESLDPKARSSCSRFPLVILRWVICYSSQVVKGYWILDTGYWGLYIILVDM